MSGNNRDVLWRWIWVAAFAVAFAWVESAVVVFLREIYYGGGFSFPLGIKWADGRLLIDYMEQAEIGREIATILMLVSVGCIAGKNRWQKFSFFMIAFGIWDIFFYAWLWAIVRWPESLMTWDLLFFLPLPWTGPVITPVLIALAMMTAGTLIIYYDEKGVALKTSSADWVVILGCALAMVVAFCWDWRNIIQMPGDPANTGIPNPFAWWLYLPALVTSITYFAARLKQMVRSSR